MLKLNTQDLTDAAQGRVPMPRWPVSIFRMVHSDNAARSASCSWVNPRRCRCRERISATMAWGGCRSMSALATDALHRVTSFPGV